MNKQALRKHKRELKRRKVRKQHAVRDRQYLVETLRYGAAGKELQTAVVELKEMASGNAD
jgi:hypothetical protein